MKTGTLIAWILLMVVGVAHLLRAIFKLDLVIGDYNLPINASWIAFFFLLLITVSMWREHLK